jgi:small basic protein (TIGR04137 family)
LASGGGAAIDDLHMSQHRSLRGQGAIKAKRNVLKRFERVEVLKKRGQFKEGQSVLGLKKTKPDE